MRKALLLILVLSACGPKRKNQCPGNTTGTCLAGEKCTWDRAHNCQACVCESINGDQTNPRDPSDPTGPPTLDN